MSAKVLPFARPLPRAAPWSHQDQPYEIDAAQIRWMASAERSGHDMADVADQCTDDAADDLCNLVHGFDRDRLIQDARD